MNLVIPVARRLRRAMEVIGQVAKHEPKPRQTAFSAAPGHWETGWEPANTKWANHIHDGGVTVGEQFILRESSPIRMAYFSRPNALGTTVVRGSVTFSDGCEGPPVTVHGGAQAAALDEAMGLVCMANNRTAVAGEIRVRFKRPVPLNTKLRIQTELVDSKETSSSNSRKLFVKGKLESDTSTSCDEDTIVYAESSGIFFDQTKVA